jgi:hypothetical protein
MRMIYERWQQMSFAHEHLHSPKPNQSGSRLWQRAMSIGNCALFTLEVSTNGATERDPNDYVDKRSAEERPGGYGREFL